MTRSQKGYSLIETLTATALMAIILTTFLSALASLGIVEVKARLRTQATQLARENMEIAYNLSVQNWQEFSKLNGSYVFEPRDVPSEDAAYPFFEVSPGFEEDVLGKYDRSVVIEISKRNDSGNIHQGTGAEIEDETTMKITSTVSWELGNSTDSVELVSYFTDLSALSL